MAATVRRPPPPPGTNRSPSQFDCCVYGLGLPPVSCAVKWKNVEEHPIILNNFLMCLYRSFIARTYRHRHHHRFVRITTQCR